MNTINILNDRFFIKELDSLRFLAFILIFIHHTNATNIVLLNVIRNIGWIGVDIFFCLSAFLLTRLLMLERHNTGSINIRNFFIRRILRIWPLYFTYVSIAILFSIYKHIITPEVSFRIIGLLTFTENIFASIYHYNPIRFTGHLWTISYEEQFYLVLPFIILLLVTKSTQQKNLYLFIALAIGVIIRLFFIYIHATHPAIWVLPVTHFESIWIGMFLGLKHDSIHKVKPLVYYIAGFLSLDVILWLPNTAPPSYHLMILYPCVGIISGSLLCIALCSKKEVLKQVLSNNVVMYLGKISFGLYVFHNFSLALTDYVLRWLEINTIALNILISFLVTILLASFSYFALEKKFLAMKTKFSVIQSR